VAEQAGTLVGSEKSQEVEGHFLAQIDRPARIPGPARYLAIQGPQRRSQGRRSQFVGHGGSVSSKKMRETAASPAFSAFNIAFNSRKPMTWLKVVSAR
jgi:hypothetical protein